MVAKVVVEGTLVAVAVEEGDKRAQIGIDSI